MNKITIELTEDQASLIDHCLHAVISDHEKGMRTSEVAFLRRLLTKLHKQRRQLAKAKS